eukprot:gb/GFBE01074850.1/.p1 GENE.gb/GFBE01074850.1/~~gb/GFBE01074850.1/.p1  ORF type:complete len:191 (+),score=55.95 gb/GFBE01074850.1/:1-573(+)
MAAMSVVSFALGGVVAFNAVSLLPQVPQASAAWGWQMTVPTNLGFECEEGAELGCPYGTTMLIGGVNCTAGTATTCPEACFKCTVKAAANKTCDVAETAVKCTHPTNGSIMPSAQDGAFMCINIGNSAYNITANNATLEWSTVPSCDDGTTAAPTTAAPTTTDGKVQVAGAAVMQATGTLLMAIGLATAC